MSAVPHDLFPPDLAQHGRTPHDPFPPDLVQHDADDKEFQS